MEGRTGFIYLILPGHSPSLKDIKEDTQSRNHGGVLLVGPVAFYTAQDHLPRDNPAHMSWALTHQLTIRKSLHEHPTGDFDLSSSSAEASL